MLLFNCQRMKVENDFGFFLLQFSGRDICSRSMVDYMARDFAKAFYNSKEWKQTREYILKRDKYLCCRCGKPATEVHHKKHLTPENIGDVSITMNPSNLESLCRDCHFEEHRGEHGNGRQNAESNPYMFDENGMLIPK